MIAGTPRVTEVPAFRRWAILFSVTLATTQHSMAILVVSVLLPLLQGLLGYPDSIIGFLLGLRGADAIGGFSRPYSYRA
jgi:hypothetical protein